MTAILLPVFQRLYIQSSWFSLMLWILCEKFKGGNLPQKKEILKFRAKAFLPSKEWEIDQDAANSLRLEGVVKHLLEFLCNFFPHYGTKFSPNYHKGTNMLNFSMNSPEFWCFLLEFSNFIEMATPLDLHNTIVVYSCLFWCIQSTHWNLPDVFPLKWANRNQDVCLWRNIIYPRTTNAVRQSYRVNRPLKSRILLPYGSLLHTPLYLKARSTRGIKHAKSDRYNLKTLQI